MAELLTTLGSVITQLFGYVGNVFTIIEEHPIALIWVAVGLAFVAVKFTKYILGI
ncbi:MAG: hypothetical protein ACI4OT_00265 [Bacilli bacterium]